MMKGIVCSESELMSAANKINAYSDFLQRQMERYTRILAATQKIDIDDALICTALTELEREVRSRSNAVFLLVDAELRETVQKDISLIEASDNFEYPNALLGKISALLAKFMR